MTPWTDLAVFGRLERRGLLPTRLPPLGSVGLSAAELARRLGTGPVVLGGLDFSYTLDAFHARSTQAHTRCLLRTGRLAPLFNPALAYREGSFPATSKSGLSVRSDPGLRSYRDLLEREFAGDSRFFEIEGPGLPLGLNILKVDEVLDLLSAPATGQKAGGKAPVPEAGAKRARSDALNAFVQGEIALLEKLRAALTGEASLPPPETARLLLDCDYLWAHFPDRAKAQAALSAASLPDISFLKRARTEIDPFLDLWGRGQR